MATAIFSNEQNPPHNYNTPGTYTVSLTIYEADGDVDNETKIEYITVSPEPIDTTPPPTITDFNASDGEDGQSTLTWTNPSDSDHAEVVIMREIGYYPADHTDGDQVFQDTSGNWNNTVDFSDPEVNAGTLELPKDQPGSQRAAISPLPQTEEPSSTTLTRNQTDRQQE